MTAEEKLKTLGEIEKQIEERLDEDGLRKAYLRAYGIDSYFESSYEVRTKKAILLARIENSLVRERMRYVRTKDGIFKVIRDDHPFYVNVEMKHTSGVMLHESVIERSDETIEDLCDCFVDYCEEDGSHFVTTDKPVRRSGHEIYGAIWTNEGLKYVATMDGKGELKLL